MGYIEETDELKLDFQKIKSMSGQEVIPVAVQNADTNEVILVAYTNEQAMLESVRLRRLVLWSTSRNEVKRQEMSLSWQRFLSTASKTRSYIKSDP